MNTPGCRHLWPLLCAIGAILPALAAAAPPVPDPRQIFAPLNLPVPVSGMRSAGGVPGPAYWQNRADYHIDASIEPATHTLRASETITYTNNSPDALDVLWVQLDQNIYRTDARSEAKPGFGPYVVADHTDGYVLDSVAIEQGGRRSAPAQLVTDTRLQLRLATPLATHGVLKLHIAYHYTVPGDWGGRTAVTDTPDGPLYEIAQWFPRMAVYDDMRGWDTLPYLGQEFYLEYGDIDYAVTVPWNYLVAGSGQLTNPDQVLTAEQRTRLVKAAGSDATVMIRAPAEVGDPKTRPVGQGVLTWKFHMDHTRDVAFTASPAFVWDAARINLPDGKHAMAMSVYPRGSVGPTKWDRSTEYVKGTIENFSRRWASYPWPVMVNLGGHGASMEYPGIVFDDQKDAGRDLFWITAHEVGHSWFPMLVGSNERRDAWMDEGFNTFIDVYASEDFNHGEFAPKRDPEFAPGGGNPVDEILPLLNDAAAPVILSPADGIAEKYRHPVSYFKPALGLVLLREQILGPARFDASFRRYIAAWSYKHPSGSDFFRLMSSEAGEDLSWWWRGWYFENTPLDMGLGFVTYADHALTIRVVTKGSLVMPAVVEIDYKDGTRARVNLPVEVFDQGVNGAITVPVTGPVARVILDPDHKLPDSDRTNNEAVPQ